MSVPMGFQPMPLPAIQQDRLSQHLQPLGMAWCAYGVLRMLGAAAAMVGLHTLGFMLPHGHGIWPFLGFSTVFFSGLSILAGLGLLARRPWARKLSIVLGFLSLFNLPFGTALGIYTFWVLRFRGASRQWRQIQVPSSSY